MTIFTDGSCAPNPGPGGFGVVVYNEDDIIIDCYAHQEEMTTNNRMELKAIIYATIKYSVKLTDEDTFVNNIPIVYSDSYYCVQALTKWMFTWAQNGWKTTRNEPIENLDLIKMYYDFNIDEKLVDLSNKVEEKIKPLFKRAEEICAINSSKVLKAFQEERVGTHDFSEITGYGFSDDGRPVANSLVIYEAMKKAKELNKPLLCHCEDLDLVNKGIFNESKLQEESGVKVNLDISETTNIARDLVIANKTKVHYHVCHLATKESLDLVKFYKSIGCNVTIEVTPHHLVLNDEMIQIAPNFKMNPPIRGKKDQEALIEGIIDGTVDMISTDHAPHSIAKKERAIEESAFGIVGSETAFPLLYTYLVKTGKISLTKLFDLMSKNVAKAFNLRENTISIGNIANIAVIDLDNEFTIDKNTFYSKGRNTPFDGYKVYGNIMKTIYKGVIVYGS